MKILVVEDNIDILDVLQLILTGHGYEVACDLDGSNLNRLDEIKPDLILLDEWLPDVKGSELCRKLKANNLHNHIPVILISAAQGVDSVSVDCGADAFVEKPFDIANLVSLIHRLVNQ